ncbi:MAG: cardiolipin hydrolase [Lentisphaeria bacterium]
MRGVSVRIISDNDKSEDMGSDITRLDGYGIPVKLDLTANHMHHKFAIADQSRLINGSFNWTRSASERNEENLVLTFEKKLLERYGFVFEDLWGRL